MQPKTILNILLIVSICFAGIPFISAHSAAIPAAPSSVSAPSSLPAFIKIVSGSAHTCALTSAGAVKCWGDNVFGQLGDGTTTDRSTPVDVVGLSSGVTALAAGSAHTCAVTSGGAVKCWGQSGYGQLGDGTYWGEHSTPVDVVGLTNSVIALTAGWGHTCALVSGGAVKCWGYNGEGELGDGTTTQRNTPVDVVGLTSSGTALAAGLYHTCSVTSSGAVKCWGNNDSGQLGDGTYWEDRSTPVDVVGLTSGVTALATGDFHTCALVSGGVVKCWGENTSGQLGNDATTNRSTPVEVVGLTSAVTALEGGSAHTCALASGGSVKCWGDNSSGQLGDGTTTQRSMPVEVVGLTGAGVALAAGSAHTCVVTSSGAVKCWGANHYGQLGNSTTQRSVPVDVGGVANGVIALATGGNHTCAAASDGAVKCWGLNRFGGLGDGTTTDRSTPVDVVGLSSGATVLAAGEYHTCAISIDGAVKCWGHNEEGELGDGTSTNCSTPVDVVGLTSGVTALAAGWVHTCALASGGALQCWGYNGFGQLGDGTTTDRSTPMDVVGLSSGVTALATGDYHTCAVTSSGAVKCWGFNFDGQLGDGTTTQRSTPVDVVGLSSGVTSLAADMHHTCAVTSSGAVKCWGNGQVTPADVVELPSGVIALAARGDHTCALTSSGAVKCWGANHHGQLGDGTTLERSTPLDVVGLSSGVTAITTGDNHTCALIAPTGRVKCFGWDGHGQLGTGAITKRPTPENVVESTPILTLNYPTGQPGSLFTLTGWNFPLGAQATLSINNQVITTTLDINETGSFIIFLDTASADLGKYFVTVSVTPNAIAMFVLDDIAPLRPQEGGGTTLEVPAGIAFDQSLYLPLIMR
jgi:alpha-tubulin suppressor-like RCC1 family protein